MKQDRVVYQSRETIALKSKGRQMVTRHMSH